MKSKSIIFTAMLTALPSALMAQQNIQKAFDALLNERIVETKTQHSLERDPETGKKTSQMDVYDFSVTNSVGLNKIKNIQKAFEKDKEAAYQIRSGSNVGSNYVALAVGDGGEQPIAIGKIKGSDFIYACFLDKDDPEKKYRYAYALEWKDSRVRLAITYATTQQYRESKNNRRPKKIIIKGKKFNVPDTSSITFSDNFPFDVDSILHVDSIPFNPATQIDLGNIGNIFDVAFGDWLTNFNNYKNLFLKNPEGTPANVYASRIYNLCKKADNLDDAEKALVSKEILKLKTKTNDEFIQNLFDMSIERLKK